MKKVIMLSLLLLPLCLRAQEFDFAKKVNGNTLYFYITSTGGKNGATVEVTYPSDNEDQPWKGYRKPSGQLTIPETVYSIEMCAFQNCSSIPEVEIAANVSEIPAQCFNGCTSLQQVTLNDGLQTISNYAFANCTSLSYVAIPASVTSIADSAFNNDPNLTLGVYYGSYAYDYAVAKGISYTLLDNVKLGDANGDGLVNVNDITTMQRGIAEMTTLEGIYLHAADIDGNGECSIDDATYVQMFLAEYELTYPIDEVMTQ